MGTQEKREHSNYLEDNATWDTVVKTFKKHGLSEFDALQQTRVAYILRAKDVAVSEAGKKAGIKLWIPETTGNTEKNQKIFL